MYIFQKDSNLTRQNINVTRLHAVYNDRYVLPLHCKLNSIRRSSTVQFLLNGGSSTTWLVGHKLVTVTTSGCQQNNIKQGLCDRYALTNTNTMN